MYQSIKRCHDRYFDLLVQLRKNNQKIGKFFGISKMSGMSISLVLDLPVQNIAQRSEKKVGMSQEDGKQYCSDSYWQFVILAEAK